MCRGAFDGGKRLMISALAAVAILAATTATAMLWPPSTKVSAGTACGEVPVMVALLRGARLVIAKLDRLSRNAHFLLGLKESGVDFVAADMPNANRLTVGIMAMVAEHEAQRISQRTKDALAAAKRRGVKLGGDRGVIPNARSHKASAEALQARTAARAADLAPIINELQAAGKTSLRAIAEGLNAQGIPTSRGDGEWTATQVMRVLERLDPFVAESSASEVNSLAV